MKNVLHVAVLTLICSGTMTSALADQKSKQVKTTVQLPKAYPSSTLSNQELCGQIQHPTAEESQWLSKFRDFDAAANLAIKALTGGDSDGAMSVMASKLEENPDLSVGEYVSRQLIPFFSDYNKSDNFVQSLAVRENSKINGYAIYRGFYTATGSRKHYLLKVMLRDGQPKITSIIPNRKFADDHPDLARDAEGSQPHVEIIKPGSSNQKLQN